MKTPRKVVVESPYRSDKEDEAEREREIQRNERYARACLRDCFLNHNEYPFAYHLLYTQEGILDDSEPRERQLGIEAGLSWVEAADATVVYTDLGITEGMQEGIDRARQEGRPVEYRILDGDWQEGGTFRVKPFNGLEID